MNETEQTIGVQATAQPIQNTKFCQHCGKQIAKEAVICPLCGCQVNELHSAASTPQVVITNTNVNSNVNANSAGIIAKKPRNKWVAFFLCFFLGFLGAHKFYEEKSGMGVLYLLTVGLFGFGWFVDCIALLFKPNPYLV